MRYSFFIVDDEETIRRGVAMALEAEYEVDAFENAEQALDAMQTKLPDLILLDVGLPGMNGIEALREIKKRAPAIPVIMITAYEDVATVVAAMKQGAYDYVVKPIQIEGLEATIRHALEGVRLRKEVQLLQERYLKENIPCFVGENSGLHEVMEFVTLVAKSPDTPVLIMGETGTGKELLAAAIHYRSPVFNGPFVPVNCAAIPKDLVESELFGYARGAFSGANPGGKKGLVEEAAGGTLFLDEIGDLSPESQAKLLRFLEDGGFFRVGEARKRHVRTRLVSATNKDIDAMIEQNLFRRDLYFRLGVVKVRVPALSERRDDIVPLARYFLDQFNRKFDKEIKGLAPAAEQALLAHVWTGNVRELRNVIERGVLIGRGPQLGVDDLGLESTSGNRNAWDRFGGGPGKPPELSGEGFDLGAALRDMEKMYLEEALRLAGGNESAAARLLRMNHHTFRYRRKKLGGE